MPDRVEAVRRFQGQPDPQPFRWSRPRRRRPPRISRARHCPERPHPEPLRAQPSAAGGSSSGSGSGSGGAPRVLSFGSSGGFYSGTYSETLPYTPRTMILGGGSATSSPQADGYQGEVVSETAPDFRTIMLPVAGGLLAFLSAAHVRRLLLHL